MPNDTSWQGPVANLQDVILMDFACQTPKNGPALGGPLQCPTKGYEGQSTIEQAWSDAPGTTPTVLPVGKMNDQANWWKSKRQAGSGYALRAVFKTFANNFPKDSIPGRVAAIGFSQGCQGIRELLVGQQDSERVDFVYACDGMHGHLSSAGKVTEESIEPWVRFGVEAASGHKMMVVTTSEVIPANRSQGVAGTEETAVAFLEYVRTRLGYREIAPRTIPRGLIGQAGYAPTPPSASGWPGWSNTMSHSVGISGPWPVKGYTIIGNLIVVRFAAQSPEEAAMGYKASNSGSAHIFQDWWVKDQVLREVLACRWAAKCEGENINPETLASAPSTTVMRQSDFPAPMLANRRFPSVLFSQANLQSRISASVSATSGLGAVGENCVLEGVFSNLMGLDEMQAARTANAFKMGAIGIGAAGLGYWLYTRIMKGRE